MVVIGLLTGGVIYLLVMMSLRGSSGGRSLSMSAWGAVVRCSPERQVAYVLPAGAGVEDHLALARYLIWQTSSGRDSMLALGVTAGGVGGWLLFATEYDIAGLLAGVTGLVLIFAQVPMERTRRPRLIRSMLIDERPRPTIRVPDPRPGVTPRVTIEAYRGRALADLIADLDNAGTAAERGQITDAGWYQLRQAMWDLAGSTRPPAADVDALAIRTRTLLDGAEKS